MEFNPSHSRKKSAEKLTYTATETQTHTLHPHLVGCPAQDMQNYQKSFIKLLEDEASLNYSRGINHQVFRGLLRHKYKQIDLIK